MDAFSKTQLKPQSGGLPGYLFYRFDFLELFFNGLGREANLPLQFPQVRQLCLTALSRSLSLSPFCANFK